MANTANGTVSLELSASEFRSGHWSLLRYETPATSTTGALLTLKIDRATTTSLQEPGKDLLQLGESPNESASPAHRFILDAIRQNDTDDEIKICFLIPLSDGWIIRSDFIERRFEGSPLVNTPKGFVSPLQHIIGFPTSQDDAVADFSTLLRHAVGGVVLETSHDSDTLAAFHHDVVNRLSYPWLSPTQLSRSRLVWVEGRKDINVSRRIYESAVALGITLVIIDNPGHWLEDDHGPWACLREAFLAVRISADESFVDRIVGAIRSYPHTVDGVMTISDARVEGVARACQILGYPTSPSAAYALAGDKAKTRFLETDATAARRVADSEELERQLIEHGLPDGLCYPLVVKPCIGWGSECVSKVSNQEELFRAAQRASQRHANSPQKRCDILVENYIDGPEVDANFVLKDGKIVFWECADDFPSSADRSNASLRDNFQETANLLPSGLPEDELVVIRDSIHKSILRMGFETGTFHCEGRVRNSRHNFAVDSEGLVDLQQVDDVNERPTPSFYLHEINARPAGYLESVATHLTWGIDYYAQQMLFAVGDTARFDALAAPFKDGPQWHLALLLIPEEGTGTMKTPDTVQDLVRRHPDLKRHIPDYNTVVKGGDRLQGPEASELSYLAYISVISRQGRKDCLRLADRVRKEFKYTLE